MAGMLGYHKFGEYTYHIPFSEKSPVFDGEEKILTYEDFIALVTEVHETYHLMQEMMQGFCLWLWDVNFKLANSVAAIAKKAVPDQKLKFPICDNPAAYPRDALKEMIQLHREYLFIQNIASNSKQSSLIIQKEVTGNPSLSSWIPNEFYNLTTTDMLECHVAILTELYISFLISTMPERFSSEIVKDCSPLFRLSFMSETYNRPLIAVQKVFQAHTKIRIIEKLHPMYDQIPNSELYHLTAFLLDYALHVPPSPFLNVSSNPDLSSLEDILPPTRFLKLVLFLIQELRNHPNELTDVRLYYSDASKILASAINEANNRSEERIGKRKTNPEDPNLHNTFFPFDKNTELWIDEIKRISSDRFFEVFKVRNLAINFRREHPDYFFYRLPIGFQMDINLPFIRMTKKDGKVSSNYMPIIRITDDMLSGDLKKRIDAVNKVLNPNSREHAITHWYNFVEDVTDQTLFCQFALAFLSEGSMFCPLTENFFSMSRCRISTFACRQINDPKNLQKQNCRLREVIENHFCNIEQFQI